jgi:hypothetical protein
MNAKCVVLDYQNGKIHVIDIDNTQDSEEIEKLLSEHYGFKLSEIEWMVTRKLIIEFQSPFF